MFETSVEVFDGTEVLLIIKKKKRRRKKNVGRRKKHDKEEATDYKSRPVQMWKDIIGHLPNLATIYKVARLGPSCLDNILRQHKTHRATLWCTYKMDINPTENTHTPFSPNHHVQKTATT